MKRFSWRRWRRSLPNPLTQQQLTQQQTLTQPAAIARRSVAVSLLTLTLLLGLHTPSLAQRAQNSPNPLEPRREGDPLLPQSRGNRPLTPLEQSELRTALDSLNQQAIAQRQAGNLTAAFEIWNRELRLRRVLGPQEEVAALSRVGAIAWEENQTTQAQLITQRLQQIEQQTPQETIQDYQQLAAIAQAYQTLRAYDPAVTLYNKLLQKAREVGFRQGEEQILNALAILHFSWFNYDQAAAAYQELLTIAREKRDAEDEAIALHQLSLIYQQNKQPEQAITYLQQLVEFYQARQEVLQIPSLKLAIGDQYRLLQRSRDAAVNYQEAFAIARTTQQAGFAANALEKLADLYKSLNQPNDALTVYRLLLDTYRLSYNWLGMMETFEQVAQLYQAAGDRSSALFAYQQALELAQQLNYPRKVTEFSTQIQALGQ